MFLCRIDLSLLLWEQKNNMCCAAAIFFRPKLRLSQGCYCFPRFSLCLGLKNSGERLRLTFARPCCCVEVRQSTLFPRGSKAWVCVRVCASACARLCVITHDRALQRTLRSIHTTRVPRCRPDCRDLYKDALVQRRNECV